MLTHVVCFKYRTSASETDRREHRRRLQGLSVLGLDGVLDLTVGPDVVRSARSYDTGLVVTFRDRAALDAYQVDPRHVEVARYGQSVSEHIVAVDFETGG